MRVGKDYGSVGAHIQHIEKVAGRLVVTVAVQPDDKARRTGLKDGTYTFTQSDTGWSDSQGKNAGELLSALLSLASGQALQLALV